MKSFRLSLLSILLAGLPVYAQVTSGELTGTVYDASGAVIAEAQVTATNEATGVQKTVKSGANGVYQLRDLLVGVYDLSVTASGFTKAESKAVSVALNATLTVNFNLQVGSASTTVEVSTAAVAIDTSTAQIQNTFTAASAVQLPQASTGSGVLNLSLLGAGVSSSGGLGYGMGPSVGGQKPTNNNFAIEGIDNNDKGITGPIVFVPNDAVSEFSLLSNNYGPEFGSSSGGQFNTVIKSGTNDFHGSIYEYLQNRNLNAVDALQAHQGLTSNPRYDNNRLGATFGGPILKNKLFFFADFEYNPIGQSSVPGQAISAPTAAGYSALASIPGVSATNLGVLQKYLPAAATANSSTPVGCAPGAVSCTPVNIPIGNVSFVGPNFSNQYNLVTSGDYDISENDQLRIRYIYNKFDGIDTAANLPVFYSGTPNYLHLATISEYHNFSPSLTNEFQVGFNRRFNNFPIGNFTFPGLDQFPNILIEQDLNLQLGPDPNSPQGYIQSNYQGRDNLTKVAGRHTIKAGYDFNDIIASNTFVQRARGDYDYTNLNQYLLDLSPDDLGERSVGAGGGIPVGFLQHAFFLNDDFKLRPNLTINLGIRWEYVTVPVASRAQKYSALADVPGVITFREPQSTNNNWGPRVGFAYSPGTSGKTSIRSGFGIAYDQFYNNLAINAKPAFYQQTVDTDPTANTPNFLKNGGIPGTVPPPPTNTLDARAGISSYTYNLTRPYSVNWSFGIQQEFATNYVLEARYVGSKGVHEYVQDRINVTSPVDSNSYLPTFFTPPSASQLAGLTTTLNSLQSISNNYLAPYGFTQPVVGYAPIGNSIYHALDLQLTRRLSHGLSLIGAYTWSHNISDSDATVFSTLLTPRRGQDFQDLRADRSSSALDHRQRLTLTTVYDFQPFKGRSWLLRNVIGNWFISGTYTYESPELATIQSGVDSNLNGDSAGDRTIINTNGVRGTGTGVYAVDATGATVSVGSPTTVAYIAKNPNAQYVQAQIGALATAGRNTFPLSPIDNIDAFFSKRFNITERVAMQFGAQFFNILNHPQYTSGFLSDIQARSFTDSRSFLIPGNSQFGQYQNFYSSNSRQMQIVAKVTF